MQSNERNSAIDALRGLALFGILLVNFEFFAMPEGSFGGYAQLAFPQFWNQFALFLCRFVCDGKFILIFSFLFGWGLKWQMVGGEHWEQRYFRRLCGLAIIGLAHAIFLFVGDILVTYALLGVPLYWVRNWPARRLCNLAAAMWGLSVAGHACLGWIDNVFRLVEPGAMSTLGLNQFAEVLRIHREGSFSEITAYRVDQLIGLYAITPLLFMPQVMGMFCLGLAFGKTFPDPMAEEVGRIASWVFWLTLVPGFIGNAWYTASQIMPHSSDLSWVALAGRGLFPPMMCLSYLAIAHRWFSTSTGVWLGSWLAGDGRCSLSLYLGESLLMGWIFNSYGLALYGRVGPLMGCFLCATVYIVLLLSAKIWLSWFRTGPAEWLLKSIIQGRKI